MSDVTAIEISEVTWSDRLLDSVQGAVLGVALIGGSVALLWWNERRAVKLKRALQEVERELQKTAGLDPALAPEGSVVHVCAVPDPEGTVLAVDPMLMGVRAPTNGTGHSTAKPGALYAISGLVVSRRVEMLQSCEESTTSRERTTGGGYREVTLYSVRRNWLSHWVNTASFRTQGVSANPRLPLDSKTYVPAALSVRGLALSASLRDQLALGPGAALPEECREVQCVGVPELRTLARSGPHFVSRNPGPMSSHVPQEQVGDVRVALDVVPVGEVSAIGRLSRGTLVPHLCSSGESVGLVSVGRRSARELLMSAFGSAGALSWLLRGAGVVLSSVGFAFLFRPLSMLSEPLPVVREVLLLGTNLGGVAAGVSLSTVTIAAAWLAYHPFVLVSLLLGSGGLVYLRSRPALL